MSFNKMMQHNLEAILQAGASLELSAEGRMQHNLVDLAKSAKAGGAHLTLTGVGSLMQHNLVDIAKAGKGFVTLRD